jgi:hypothetical protein
MAASVDPEDLLFALREALRRLASSPNDQMKYLRDRFGGDVLSVDELALELDDVAGAVKPHLFPAAAAAVDELESWLKGMGGNAHAALWTEEALAEAAEWARARELALDALAKVGPT